MDFGLKGRRALVTGASSGLGRAIADTLVKERATVAVSSRGGEKLQKAAKELGAALAVPCDLTQPGAARGLVREVTEKLGGLDVLVVNAEARRPEASSPSRWSNGRQGSRACGWPRWMRFRKRCRA